MARAIMARAIMGRAGGILVQGRAERMCHPASNVPPRFPLINNSLTTVFRVTLELLTGWEYRPAF